jgi:hypothetical protein
LLRGRKSANIHASSGVIRGIPVYGINSSESDPLQLRRIEVDVQKHWLLVAADVSGIRHVCSVFLRKQIAQGCAYAAKSSANIPTEEVGVR